MKRINYEMQVDGILLSEAARRYGTPLYVYSRSGILERIQLLKSLFSQVNAQITFALKANSNVHLLSLLKDQNVGADAVSMGEMMAAFKAGFSADQMILNGNGKTGEELSLAIEKNIFAVNIDSPEEFEFIIKRIKRYSGKRLRCFLRLNPDINPNTHPYISTGLKYNKFGMDFNAGRAVLKAASSIDFIDIIGIHMHIGSQLLDAAPYREAFERAAHFFQMNREFDIPFFNIGGGWGIDYSHSGKGFPVEYYKKNIIPLLKKMNKRIIVEMGRFLMAQAGILLGRVLYEKITENRTFIVTDIGMNDLLRPSLYVASHFIEPVKTDAAREKICADIVGPLCETGDRLAQDYEIQRMLPDEYIAVSDAGAYGWSMSSNYNMRTRPAEVLLYEGRMKLIRPRETCDDLLSY